MRGKFWRNRLNKVLSMLVSLALAFFLWLALAGQDTSTLDLTVPLELANLPSELAIKTEVPGSVTVQVLANTAQGRFLADRKLHLWLNVASAKEGLNGFQITDDSLDLPRGVQLRKITPSIIEFEAVKLSDKMVPIKPVVSGQVNMAYRIKSLIIEPDQAFLKGPHELLENIEEISTAPIALEGLTQNHITTVTLPTTDLGPGLEVSPKEIRAIISVEEIMERKTFPNLPIEIDRKNGYLPGSQIVVSPETVEVSMAWPAIRMRGVASDAIQAKVYVDDEKLRKEGVLTLQIVVVPPDGITVTAINPASATVTYVPPVAPEESSEPAGSSENTPEQTP